MTTPRLPTVDDLSKNLLCDILPSKDGKNTNILILLHGLGDTKEGFTQLGESSHPVDQSIHFLLPSLDLHDLDTFLSAPIQFNTCQTSTFIAAYS